MKKFGTFFLMLTVFMLSACSRGGGGLSWALEKYDAENFKDWDQTLQCYTFVRQVLKSEGRGDLPSFSDIEGEANRNGQDAHYGRYYPTHENHLVGKILYDEFKSAHGRYPTADEVKSVFGNAQVGDVVQMYFDTGSPIQHTAIISRKLNDGIQFLHANYDGQSISNKGPDTYTLEDGTQIKYFAYWHFAQCCERCGDAGGFSIYRYTSSSTTETPTTNSNSIEGTYTATGGKNYRFADDQNDGDVTDGTFTIRNTAVGENRDILELNGLINYNNNVYTYFHNHDLTFLKGKKSDGYILWNTRDEGFIDAVNHAPIRVSANISLEQTGSETIKLQINQRFGGDEVYLRRTSTTISSSSLNASSSKSNSSGLGIGINQISSSATEGGYMWIGGNADDDPYYLNKDNSGTGWLWNSDTGKLTLNSNYTGQPIFISSYYNPEFDNVVKIEINGNVTINGGDYGTPIRIGGSAEIMGDGSINLVPSSLAAQYSMPTIRASGSLTFSGASTTASAEEELNRAVVSDQSNVILNDDAKVTAKAKGVKGYAVYSPENVILNGNSVLIAEGEGKDSAGIIVKSGDIVVNDDASLTAKGIGEGYAVEIRKGELKANNNNVVLQADDENHTSTKGNTGTGTVTTEINKTEEPEKTPERTETETKTENDNPGNSGGGCNLSFAGLTLLAALFMIKRK